MIKKTLPNEDDLGVPRGLFSGRQIGPRLDAALAKKQERENENQDGREIVKRVWRGVLCLILGLVIGAGSMAMFFATKLGDYLLGVISGLALLFLYIGLRWCIPKVPPFCLYLLYAIRSYLWK